MGLKYTEKIGKIQTVKELGYIKYNFSSVQSLSHVRLFTTLWTAAHLVSLSITGSQSLLTLMCIESLMPSNHLILCHPLLSCLQSFPASGSFPTSQPFVSLGVQFSCSYSRKDQPSKCSALYYSLSNGLNLESNCRNHKCLSVLCKVQAYFVCINFQCFIIRKPTLNSLPQYYLAMTMETVTFYQF